MSLRTLCKTNKPRTKPTFSTPEHSTVAEELLGHEIEFDHAPDGQFLIDVSFPIQLTLYRPVNWSLCRGKPVKGKHVGSINDNKNVKLNVSRTLPWKQQQFVVLECQRVISSDNFCISRQIYVFYPQVNVAIRGSSVWLTSNNAKERQTLLDIMGDSRSRWPVVKNKHLVV